MLLSDRRRHVAGVKHAASRWSWVMRGARQTAQSSLCAQDVPKVSKRLSRLRKPPQGVRELFTSPMTFIVALNAEGTVVARNARPDSLVGQNWAVKFPLVRRALPGASVSNTRLPDRTGDARSVKTNPPLASCAEDSSQLIVDAGAPLVSGSVVEDIVTFANADGKTNSEKHASVVWMFVAPVLPAIAASGAGRVGNTAETGAAVGAIVVGFPLWRLAQRVNRQLHIEQHSKHPGRVLWTYFTYRKRLHHFGTPPDLDALVPSFAVRERRLASSAKGGETATRAGYTDQVMQHSRWYGYGVFPLDDVKPELGLVVFQMDP